MKTIAVIGWKNSGKTTLVSRLVANLRKKKFKVGVVKHAHHSFDIDHPNTDSYKICLLYTSPSPRDRTRSRMPSSA